MHVGTGQTFAAEQRANTLAQLLRSRVNHSRGNFFAPDFEQKIWHR
jgi:hypothetical protein